MGSQTTTGVPCGRTYALTIDGYHVDTTAAPEPDPPADLTLACLTNPTRRSAEIRYTLNIPVRVTVGIYDVAGRLLHTLVDGVEQAGGIRRCDWNGRDDAGR